MTEYRILEIVRGGIVYSESYADLEEACGSFLGRFGRVPSVGDTVDALADYMRECTDNGVCVTVESGHEWHLVDMDRIR
jgi:hypothetical protein